MREQLEAAIHAHPDDPRVYAIYADWLTEQGDPRGEFIHLQLQLEDPAIVPEVRLRLQDRETQLLEAHGATWLGSLPQEGVTLRRGFLDQIVRTYLDAELLRALVASPELTRTLRRLELDDLELGPGEMPLLAELSLPRLERFRLDGPYCGGEGLETLLAGMPALQELRFMALRGESQQIFSSRLPKLTTFVARGLHYHPIGALARNESLRGLQVLELEPHALEPGDEPYLTLSSVQILAHGRFSRLRSLALRQCNAGDEGIAMLLESPLFSQLESLDLSYGLVTDEGAEMLARALLDRPSLLRRLRLEYNHLTERGKSALDEVGIEVDAEQQYAASDTYRYLLHGSWE